METIDVHEDNVMMRAIMCGIINQGGSTLSRKELLAGGQQIRFEYKDALKVVETIGELVGEEKK